VPLLLDNLTATGQVAKVYLPNLRQSLVILPADVNDLASAIMNSSEPGAVNVNFRVQESSPCTTGYATKMRQPTDTAPEAAPSSQPYCTSAHSSPQQVRGAHNDPCPNNPGIKSATAAGCGLNFGASGDPAESDGGTSAAGYDPGSGLLVGPNGLLYSVGSGTISGNGPTTLPSLLQETLGG
jgi:phospholipid/cholesterol/gamma-HCH transport system substrate-binding protein